MFKKLVILISVIIIPILLTRSAHASTHLVCVDAGHGGSDTGAVYQGLEEKTVTLDIATRLETLLQNAGYSVVPTRIGDITLTNSQRAAICNQANAEVLISIHLNASSNHNTDYTQGLYGKKLKDEPFTNRVHNTLANELGITNGGITNFADGMLLKTNMPATLQETVFITSDYEYALLTDGLGDRQKQIAQALNDGVVSWFGGK